MQRRRHALSQAISLTVLAMGANTALADYEVPNAAFNPPTTYYNTATGTASTLRNSLHDIIDGTVAFPFQGRNYGQARYAMGTGDIDGSPATGGGEDLDPNNVNNILLVYNRASISGKWDAGTHWNREHVWPKSLLNLTSSQVSNSYTGVASDAFELRPSDPGINSARSNDGYGFYINNSTPGSTYGTNSGYWNPGAADRGDVSRIIFYMATRWLITANSTHGTGADDLELKWGAPTTYNFGDLNSLLHWNYMDGVDNFERRRNQQIYGSAGDLTNHALNPTYYQGNRNPYVDHPEYVWAVFGKDTFGGQIMNSSKIYVGGSAPSDGASSQTVSMRIMRNGTFGTNNVTVNKTGATPTTYDVTSSGSANITSTFGGSTLGAGIGQPFDYGSVTKSITVGLSGSTSTTGLKTGSVTLNNTDLTTAGTGQGSADGNDVITINGQVVDNRVITASAADFGRVIAGENVTTNTTLSSPDDDDHFTRVTVKADGTSADSNGVSISAGIDNTFNGTLVNADRTLQANFATTGGKSGSRSFVMQGEGLSGESVNGVSVSYSATAVDHAQPSFASGVSQTSQSIDFGYVPSGLAARTEGFSVYNNATGAGAALTAALDVDSVSGSTAQMSTDVSPSSNLAADDSIGYTATFTPDTVAGDNSTVQTIHSFDENIPGATARPDLALTTNGRTVTTGTFPVTGFMKLLSGETYSASAFEIQAGVTLTYNGPGTMNVDGTQNSGLGSALLVTDGVVNMNSDAGSASSALLAITSNGTSSVTFNSTQHLASLTIAGTTVQTTAGANKVISTGALSVTGGKIDLQNNKLVVRNTPAGSWNGSAYTGIAGLVQGGRNGGGWGGNGIVTSQTHATPGNYTTLAVATAAQAKGIAATATTVWAGETISGTDTLVMYTYGGDANFDGKLDIGDYGRIDTNIALAPGLRALSYANGDFNYDGLIDVGDYGILDVNIVTQGTPFSTASGGGGMSVVPVPEPAWLGLSILALGLRRRRRK